MSVDGSRSWSNSSEFIGSVNEAILIEFMMNLGLRTPQSEFTIYYILYTHMQLKYLVLVLKYSGYSINVYEN
jgi:hypothetical protein